ncbi:MAG: hypothetical protein KF760_27275 [Candidatus Eremiobacteraeota bacterium]|nr:hypothetical protein [Candidatus Eremiobacteraeota bacterium]MCW5872425.1 hypothetical protein [Candidatus Eremiobacteraeota bacterium]
MKKNWLEWCVFALGLVLTLSILGYLIFLGLNRGEQPPIFKVTVGSPQKVSDGYQLRVDVYNQGDVTAQSVQVEVENRAEKARFQIDFVPEHSSAKGWVVFSQEPDRPKGKVTGFTAQ